MGRRELAHFNAVDMFRLLPDPQGGTMSTITRRNIIAGFATCLCCAAARAEDAHGAHKPAHWTYDDVAAWAEKDSAFKACAVGGEQSPIDLVGAVAAEVDAPRPIWHQRAAEIVNNGHTIQVEVPAGGKVVWQDVDYALKQYHFHAPSEHALAGRRTAMEAHFVHAADNGSLLVIGVLFTPGAVNDAFAAVMRAAPPTEGAAVLAAIDLTAMLPHERGVFRYEGSLTTPPCSEIVHWNVFDTPVEVAQADIDAFMRIYKMNARPLQARGKRVLTHS